MGALSAPNLAKTAHMPRLEFTLTGDYVELHNLLKLMGLADSGGSAKARVAEGEVKVDRLVAGDRAAMQQTLLRDLCDTMLNGSLCALGGLTPYPVLSALDYFSEDFSKPAALQAAKR